MMLALKIKMNIIHRHYLNRMICNTKEQQLRRKIDSHQLLMEEQSCNSTLIKRKVQDLNLYVSFNFDFDDPFYI